MNKDEMIDGIMRASGISKANINPRTTIIHGWVKMLNGWSSAWPIGVVRSR